MSSIGVLFQTAQLRYTHPEAFKALPEPYQEDDCLVFWTDCNGNLRSAPDEDDVVALGAWEAVFNPKTKSWVTG